MKINAKILSLGTILSIITFLMMILSPVQKGSSASSIWQTTYADQYFDRNSVMQINIEISEQNWADMIDNAAKEEFHEADITVNGDKYSMVYIRPKGNSSLSTISKSKFNEEGHLKRFSLKVNFDSLNKNQTLAGLTQLNLNNGFSDPSFIREYLGYQIFEGMGVNVPAFSFADVSINGEYFGLFLAVESILEPYLVRHFGDDSGVLYKSVGNKLTYTGKVSTDTKGLEVKTGGDKADTTALMKLMKSLETGQGLEQILDVDQALRYFAVSTALVNFDSYQGNFGHNYYLYEQNGKFTVLPWDLNMAFGGFNLPGDFSSFYIDEPTQGALAERPLIAALLQNETYKERYHEYLQEIIDKYLNKTYLESEISRLVSLISDSVYKDPTALYTYEDFKANTSLSITEITTEKKETASKDSAGSTTNQSQDTAVRKDMMREKASFSQNTLPLLSFALATAESIQQQLKGEIPSTNNGKGMGGEMSQGPGMPPAQWENQDGMQPPPMGELPEGAFKEPFEGAGDPMQNQNPNRPEGPPNGMDRPMGPEGMNLQGNHTGILSTWIIVISGLIMLIAILVVLWIPKRKWISVHAGNQPTL